MNIRSWLRNASERAPNAAAIADASGALTYRELEELSNRFAGALVARGIGREDRVVIWSDKSIEVVACMQAVLQLGAAYVPLDGASPAFRVAKISEQVDAALVVVSSDLAGALAQAGLARSSWTLPSREPVSTRAEDGIVVAEIVSRDVDDLAYILFTSGSTGEPKGVCTSQGNVAAFVNWAAEHVGLNAQDRIANHASFSFDLSVFDLYASFLIGAQVVLVPSMVAYVPSSLLALLRRHRISVLYAVPTAYVLMLDEGLSAPPGLSLRVAIFAGEPFPLAALARLAEALPWARLLNFYGPTETNVCTAYEVTRQDLGQPIPIGSATCGNRVYAVRNDGVVAEVGEEGELMVEGPTVMLGYWGQPSVRSRPYATGDLVRVLPGGQFFYLGRRDAMLKIRGHRVEPAEVELALQASPRVRRVAVVVDQTGEVSKLKAFVVSAPGERLSLMEAKRLCAERLPKYMIIDELQLVDDLPRTSTGKISRRALSTWSDR